MSIPYHAVGVIMKRKIPRTRKNRIYEFSLSILPMNAEREKRNFLSTLFLICDIFLPTYFMLFVTVVWT